jgi:hypothetical protein
VRNRELSVDFCVVGGGMSGTIAAMAAARKGVKVALVQDRPMLGGNASSEIRMHICGAHGENNHETGILEEILLENSYRQGMPNYSIWDTVVWEKAFYQENLTILLNCTVNRIAMDGNRILSVDGWQFPSETNWKIEATQFADCTGEGLLGEMAGAEYRIGREARSEYNESIAPEVSDKKTMGMSLLIQLREYESPQTFVAPDWAYKYEKDEDLPERGHHIETCHNFWWMEVGGEHDSIHDTEDLREELLKIAYGVWDHMKNRGDHGAQNWALDWIGFLPGKRESRRFLGDHVLTQNDIEAEGRHFDDIVAYGGWTMDDHFPAGFYHKKGGTIFHPAPSPYGIPYRCLYSRNIDNMFLAGRNISTTHAAMSSTRVMATCSVMGQAVGTAAALAVQNDLDPRGIYEKKIKELKNQLMEDDCYLPFTKRPVSPLTASAEITTSNGKKGEELRNGFDRIIGDDQNCWEGVSGDSITYNWKNPIELGRLRLVLDSDLSRKTHNMTHSYALDQEPYRTPAELLRGYKVDLLKNGKWEKVAEESNNYQRLINIDLNSTASAVRLTLGESWGREKVRIFAMDV